VRRSPPVVAPAIAARGLRVDLDDLLDPARYLGLAAAFVDETLAEEDA
jgi:3-carboxy-cis,cis-muconate cycloisomerase